MAEHYTGGCHCGAVRFKCEADLSTVIECNCSHCSIKGLLMVFPPKSQFTLESGEDSLTQYRFNKRVIAHQFCKVCGVEPFAFGTDPKGVETAAINVRCLDGLDLTTLNRVPYDGAKA
ncbi:MAG TPA: GFA family protein [Caulobacteraceae bacterium]